MIDKQKIDERDIFFFREKKRNRIDIPLDVYASFSISRFFFISLYLPSLHFFEREQMDPIPYIEH